MLGLAAGGARGGCRDGDVVLRAAVVDPGRDEGDLLLRHRLPSHGTLPGTSPPNGGSPRRPLISPTRGGGPRRRRRGRRQGTAAAQPADRADLCAGGAGGNGAARPSIARSPTRSSGPRRARTRGTLVRRQPPERAITFDNSTTTRAADWSRISRTRRYRERTDDSSGESGVSTPAQDSLFAYAYPDPPLFCLHFPGARVHECKTQFLREDKGRVLMSRDFSQRTESFQHSLGEALCILDSGRYPHSRRCGLQRLHRTP